MRLGEGTEAKEKNRERGSNNENRERGRDNENRDEEGVKQNEREGGIETEREIETKSEMKNSDGTRTRIRNPPKNLT